MQEGEKSGAVPVGAYRATRVYAEMSLSPRSSYASRAGEGYTGRVLRVGLRLRVVGAISRSQWNDGFRPTPVLPEAGPVRALSAQLRRPRRWSAMSAIRRIRNFTSAGKHPAMAGRNRHPQPSSFDCLPPNVKTRILGAKRMLSRTTLSYRCDPQRPLHVSSRRRLRARSGHCATWRTGGTFDMDWRPSAAPKRSIRTNRGSSATRWPLVRENLIMARRRV